MIPEKPYEPEEDSYLLEEAVEKRFSPRRHTWSLDMGTGSGLIAETLHRLGARHIVALDISRAALRNLECGMGVLSDLFSGLHKRFDFIAFNPPYLPDDGGEPDPTTIGGKGGYETVLKFLDQLPDHLTRRGECLLLVSIHTRPGVVEAFMKEKGLRFRVIEREKMFFEELFVYSITI